MIETILVEASIKKASGRTARDRKIPKPVDHA
jgi:hypothetical protein